MRGLLLRCCGPTFLVALLVSPILAARADHPPIFRNEAPATDCVNTIPAICFWNFLSCVAAKAVWLCQARRSKAQQNDSPLLQMAVRSCIRT